MANLVQYDRVLIYISIIAEMNFRMVQLFIIHEVMFCPCQNLSLEWGTITYHTSGYIKKRL